MQVSLCESERMNQAAFNGSLAKGRKPAAEGGGTPSTGAGRRGGGGDTGVDGDETTLQLAFRVAKRSEEQARLRSELRQLEHDLCEERQKIEQMKGKVTKSKADYCLCAQESHAVEYEVHSLQLQIEKCREDSRKLTQQSIEYKERLEDLQASFPSEELVMGSHQYLQELYTAAIVRKSALVQETRDKRHKKLKILVDQTGNLVEERAWMQQRKEQSAKDAQLVKRQHQEGNEELSNLATLVKAELAKVGLSFAV